MLGPPPAKRPNRKLGIKKPLPPKEGHYFFHSYINLIMPVPSDMSDRSDSIPAQLGAVSTTFINPAFNQGKHFDTICKVATSLHLLITLNLHFASFSSVFQKTVFKCTIREGHYATQSSCSFYR